MAAATDAIPARLGQNVASRLVETSVARLNEALSRHRELTGELLIELLAPATKIEA